MIEVLSIPPAATVQDLGRDGHWHQGLGRAGAMDCVSHRIANMMLGNDDSAATVELALTPARLRFGSDQAFALAGAVCGARLGGRALPRVFAGVGRAGEALELGAMTRGARVYLALPGGIDVPEVLGSRSTQLREGFGGFAGRVLAPGDRLEPGREAVPALPEGGLSFGVAALGLPAGGDAIALRALPSTEHDDFTDGALQAFWSTPYTVTPRSDRQGYRLDGEELSRTQKGELRSHGIVPGIVQVPSNGQPIVQLADSATMGGYPKIAAVIEADLWRIAQARPGERVRFHRVDLAEADRAARELETLLSAARSEVEDLTAQQRCWA